MQKLSFFLLLLFTIFLISACSSTEETTKSETTGKDSVYVFDEVPKDTLEIPEEVPDSVIPDTEEKYYIVQIGAFTTEEKANEFAEKGRKELNKEVVVIYSNQVNLFVVQLTTLYPVRSEAEKIRNELWQMDNYKDAWILSVTK